MRILDHPTNEQVSKQSPRGRYIQRHVSLLSPLYVCIPPCMQSHCMPVYNYLQTLGPAGSVLSSSSKARGIFQSCLRRWEVRLIMADLRDEHGNPIQLTDEHGNPVQLTDEFGNPMHLTGVATTVAKYESTGGEVGQQQQLHREGDDGSPRRSSSSSSSSSEDDEQGGRRKKKGLKQKIKEKFSGSGKHKEVEKHHSATVETKTTSTIDVELDDHDKKSVMEKIKEKLPGHHNH